ncbi:nucleotidyltransferase family protein [uncultured Prevotella sp.]|uniref:nucleotidyltransferase family protein n=1 Tax=uncultured Prevotella sp. TaxID=159272 RepID=UPI002588A511|nr:nucleotidyltransferase family protein [uncultured Prevotella sp.]
MKLSNNQQAFLELVKAGLWEKDARLLPYGNIDFQEIYRLAQEQAVIGLVAAGFEHVVDVKIPQVWALQFAGQTIQLEQRNRAMNQFIADLVAKMRKADICTLLVKGQGIAQCYERPLWRSSGDIDFLLSVDNYNKAIAFLKERYTNNKNGGNYSKENAFYTDQWMIEVHGTLRTCLASKIDKAIDDVQRDVFFGSHVRSWNNGGTTVFLPAVSEDVILVFTHFIKHFYKEGGVTLRQLCDWCRLLWKYQSTVKLDFLKTRLKKAGLISEWRAFAALAVDYLGLPNDSMPLYSQEKKWSDKAELILEFILKGGEWRKLHDTVVVGKIFPVSTLRFLPGIILNVNWLKIKERLFS